MNWGKRFIDRDNFILVRERYSSKDFLGPLVVRVPGYTLNKKALNNSWIKNQIEIIPKSNRYHLSDPFIIPRKLQRAYDKMDCNVFTLYFKPECRGLVLAMKEFAKFFEEEMCSPYMKGNALIGYSKGGVFVAGITKYLNNPTNVLMIAPAFGSIMGDEQDVIAKLDDYLESQSALKMNLIKPEVALYKKVTHMMSSRRPIDKNTAINSSFLISDLDLTKLPNHNAMLITVKCPDNPGLIDRAVMHYGKYLGLDKDSDGIVGLEEQSLPAELCRKVIRIEATHPTALNKANTGILYFLYDSFF